MKWLRKIWDEYNYLLFLPFILLIGIAIIGLVAFASSIFSWIVNQMPSGLLGILFGLLVMSLSFFFLKNEWKKETFGWHLAAKTNVWIVLAGIFGFVTAILSVCGFFVPNLVEFIYKSAYILLILAVLMFICVFGGGLTLAQGIILLRRKDRTGIILILISIVGTVTLNGANINFAEKFAAIHPFLGIFILALLILTQIILIGYLYVFRAFRVDPWTLGEKNANLSEEDSRREIDE